MFHGFLGIAAWAVGIVWLMAPRAATVQAGNDAPDPCAKAAETRAASLCADRLGAAWDPDYFGAATERHEFREGQPARVLVQWQCHIDDGPVTTAVQDCASEGGPSGSATRILNGVETYPGEGIRGGGFGRALVRADGSIDRVVISGQSSHVSLFHVVGLDPRTGIVADLMPGGLSCLTLNIGDLDGDGGSELICERYLSMGVMYVPQVMRFENGRYVDRTGRFPALLRAAADEYLCATDIARFDAWALLNELVAAFPKLDLGPIPSDPDRLWDDAVSSPTCVLTACSRHLLNWTDASDVREEASSSLPRRYLEYAGCLFDEALPGLRSDLDSLLEEVRDSLVIQDPVAESSSPGLEP
jgi:hypothetical protein